MALIILEGLDRTGKSSVADFYKQSGFEIIHMSAPAKGTTSDQYLGEMSDLLTSLAGRDVVLDRSHYGELIWPTIYGRKALLSEEEIDELRYIEESLDVERILMHDINVEAHWQRCVDNKEPLTKLQFVKARNLYYGMAEKYGFSKRTLNDFPGAAQMADDKAIIVESVTGSTDSKVSSTESSALPIEPVINAVRKTSQQIKLEKANAINDVLDKRIIKGKGALYDELETSVRTFLNSELEKLFGNNKPTSDGFSKDEVQLLKFFCERLKTKKETE